MQLSPQAEKKILRLTRLANRSNVTLARIELNRTRLQRHRFIGHLVYSVRYSAVPIKSSLLTITLYLLGYNNTRL
jgi:hypothetical protein